jgi:hypothetical protein
MLMRQLRIHPVVCQVGEHGGTGTAGTSSPFRSDEIGAEARFLFSIVFFAQTNIHPASSGQAFAGNAQ